MIKSFYILIVLESSSIFFIQNSQFPFTDWRTFEM